jgi:hypothetical protein
MVPHVFALQVESSLQYQNQAKSDAPGDKTLKKSDRKAYPEVAPLYPLSGYIRRIGSKSVVVPASGRRGGAIAPSDLTRVVHTKCILLLSEIMLLGQLASMTIEVGDLSSKR